jgi:hypothetical protein
VIKVSTTKLVSTSNSWGSSISSLSNEKTPLLDGGLPRGRMGYLPRIDREKLIEVFALTLLVAARIPRDAPVFLEALDFDLRLEDITYILREASTRPNRSGPLLAGDPQPVIFFRAAAVYFFGLVAFLLAPTVVM